ncbi:MAG: UDP-glucose 4-epimerase GalE [Methylophaga sp.]|nr:UDP-glucose 4-epimerase GalE [Methylophaga sp.]
MSILVLGGAGYIGSHTCVELVQAGYDVVVFDNFCNSSAESLARVEVITGKNITLIKADVRDKSALQQVFKQYKIDAAIHFAGLKAVGESVSNPLKYYDNNFNATVTLCEVMAEFDCKNLIFSSSATVYGDADEMPIKEDAPLSATNPYGRSKLMIEDLLRDLAVSDNNWNAVILRYFNPVGAHDSGLIGEDPTGIPNNLMPYISQVAGGTLECLSVYGGDYDTVDGTGVRDYIHVVDLAKGHLKALNYLLNNKGVISINLGTGVGYSVLEMVNAFQKASGKEIKYKRVGRRPGDVAVCYADASLAKVKLGWKAELGLNRMCQDSWRWQENNPIGYKS